MSRSKILDNADLDEKFENQADSIGSFYKHKYSMKLNQIIDGKNIR
jgi:hypothetical protein